MQQNLIFGFFVDFKSPIEPIWHWQCALKAPPAENCFDQNGKRYQCIHIFRDRNVQRNKSTYFQKHNQCTFIPTFKVKSLKVMSRDVCILLTVTHS